MVVRAQARLLTIKRLFHDFEADFVALDCLGVGIAVHDELIKVTRDDERDIEYEPWKVYNDDALVIELLQMRFR